MANGESIDPETTDGEVGINPNADKTRNPDSTNSEKNVRDGKPSADKTKRSDVSGEKGDLPTSQQ
jgi:hypothetical protein